MLARAAHGWLTAWRESSGNSSARLILVGHSMGGLVSRYFLECLEGWEVTRALVTFGTPYRGSLNALDGLSNGLKKAPVDLSDLVRELSALYQLLPVYECYDPGNGTLARPGETTGIPNVDAGRAAEALAFHREIEEAVASNRKLPRYQTSGYRIFPVVGRAQPTNLSARLTRAGVEMLRTYKEEAQEGDGTVPRVSAIPIEMSHSPTNVMYAATQHGSLQNADAVVAHLVGVLSGLNLDLGAFRKPATQVALEVEDVFFANEPIVVRARPTRDAFLKATLWRTSDGQRIAVKSMQAAAEEWQGAQFGSPGAGAYRVTITGSDVEPVEDAFAVAEPDA